MLKTLYDRSKHFLAGAALCAAVATPLLTPKPAEAWWGPVWGWRGGVVAGLPPVWVVPAAPAPIAYPYPYVAPYAYAPPNWRWVPAYRNVAGVTLEGHWEHR